MVLYLIIAVGIIALIVLHGLCLPKASGVIGHAFRAQPIAALGATLTVTLAFSADAQYFSDPRPSAEVGILEEVYFGEAFVGSPQSEVEELYRPIVRVAFSWWGDYWRSYQYSFEQAAKEGSNSFSFWRQRHWYLRESDERYQDVVSLGEPWASWQTCFAGQHVISAPTDANPRSTDFSGCLNHPVRPPKVLCTRKPFPDTDGWSNQKSIEFADLPSNVIKEIEKYLLNDVILEMAQAEVVDKKTVAKFVESVSCRRNSKHYGIYEVRVNYDEADSDLIDQSKMPIEDPVCICTGPEADGEAWLLGDGLKLFFIGDLTGNGESELVFWIDGYNRNGYLLANSDLRAVATYEWSYH